jgi:ADP-heptose:LPS heptosyltransferase
MANKAVLLCGGMGDIAAISALSHRIKKEIIDEFTLITYDIYVELARKISCFKEILPFYKEDIGQTVSLINTSKFDSFIDLHSSSYQTKENAVLLNSLEIPKLFLTKERIKLLRKDFHNKVELIPNNKTKEKIRNVDQYLQRMGIFENINTDNLRIPKNKKMATKKKVIGIVPKSEYKQKEWPYKNWIELVKNIKNCEVKILCAEFEVKSLQDIKNKTKAEFWVAKTPEGHLESIQQCDLIISIDSGIKHLAAYSGKHVISLYSSGSHEIWGTHCSNEIVNFSNEPCYPCNSSYFCLRGNNECIQSIKPKKVYAQMIELGYS